MEGLKMRTLLCRKCGAIFEDLKIPKKCPECGNRTALRGQKQNIVNIKPNQGRQSLPKD